MGIKSQVEVRMIKSVQFRNFKVLRDATLPLGRFTLIVGPNGSGKSTALQALQAVNETRSLNFHKFATAGLQLTNALVEVILRWGAPHEGTVTTARWTPGNAIHPLFHQRDNGTALSDEERRSLDAKLARIRTYSLDSRSISAVVQLQPNMELDERGGSLAGVLDCLRDREPERFEALNAEVSQWFPEFDRVLFETLGVGQRAFLLRTREDRHAIPAANLSQGTLLALAILTLGYLPEPPSIVCLEEPDRGIHPRLLREIRDALYRLSYPENSGEKRDPVQVVATTHSPYLLDLYRDHPEEIVIAQKTSEGARFERLSEQPHIMEILGDAPLGEVWYSGILGGVPAEQ